jgi:geranylgeranyl diphosphate synthase type II
MVHAYSLVHDDLPAMDDDDLRRGRPTCHKVFGEATAILAGDALLAMAFETLALCVRPAETAARCCAVLAEAAGPCQLVGGQADDIAASGLKLADLGKDALDLLHAIHRRKTGAMICAALQLGAMTAAAPPVQLAALAEYGASLGLAFQIADDLLDARGDEAAMGKRVGKDAASGKLTFPGLVGVDESTRRAQQLIGQARAALAPLAGPTDGLEALARYVLERNR